MGLTNSGGCLLLAVALLVQSTAAQFGYGNSDLSSEVLQAAISPASTTIEVPLLESCSQAADQCCQYSSSVAECSSTVNKNKGCRSHNKCVPIEDPCWGATSRTSCSALGSFCKFDAATQSCAVDIARHPCASIISTDTCSSTASCRVQHTCKDVCSTCSECLEGARAFAEIPGLIDNVGLQVSLTSEAEAFFRGFCIASTKGAEPAQRAEIMAGCSKIIEDANKSPGLLQRPGALCTRLGICQASCKVAATGLDGSASQNLQSISMCSATGLDDGTASSSAIDEPKPESACVTSKDCPAGLECDTFTDATCYQTCEPVSGLDKCIAAGTCVDVCERPDIKAAVQESEQRLRPCDTTESCGHGEVCRAPSFKCNLVTCKASNVAEGLDPVVLAPCPSICWPTKPRMLSAAFSNDGNSIQVTLNQEAAPLDSLCLNIFDSETTKQIGALSTCKTDGKILTIWLAGYVNIRPGQATLRIGDDNLLLVPAFGDDGAVFSGELENGAPVASCSDCTSTAVYVTVKGPAEIAMPCSNAAQSDPAPFLLGLGGGADDTTSDDTSSISSIAESISDSIWGHSRGFTFSALLPTDSIWSVDDIKWSVLEPAGVQALQELVEATNSKPYVWDKQLLEIPVAALPSIPEGPITLSVAVTNLFGITSTAALQFNKKNSSEAPVFELDKSQTQFYPADGFQLVARPKAGQCRNARAVWTWATDIPNVQLGALNTGVSVVLTAWDLIGNVEPGKEYNVTLTASYEGGDARSVDTITMTAVGSPLAVQLMGPSGTVPMHDGNLTFDAASSSYDPDDPDSVLGSIAYLWKCQNKVDRSPCFGSIADGVLTLDPSQLRSNQKYTITVTAAKGNRNSSSSLTVIPMERPLPSGLVIRKCGFDLSTGDALDCPAMHNPDEPLSLIVVPDAQYTDAEVEWWYDPVAVPGVELDDENTMTGTEKQVLIILPEALPAGGSVTVNVNLTMENEDDEEFTGMQSITVAINSPPYCTQPKTSSCILLNKATSTFPDTEFQIGAAGWADPDNSTLTYEFGIYTDLGPQLLAAGTGQSYSISGLLPGDNRLYVCAVDSYGAKACQDTIVTVQPPDLSLGEEDVEDRITRIDIPYLDDTQDYPSMVGAAMKLASLLAYSAKNAVDDTLHGGHLHLLRESSAGSNSRLDSPLAGNALVANATNWLMRVMGGAGLGSPNNPDKMNSLLTAGARLSNTGSLDAEGGHSLLNLFRSTMTANKNSGRSITEQQTNNFADALSNGIKAASKARTTGAGSDSSNAGEDGVVQVHITPPPMPELTPEAQAKLDALKQQGLIRAASHLPPKHKRSLLAMAVDKSKSSSEVQAAGKANATRGPLSAHEAFSTLQHGAFNLSTAQKVVLGGAAKVAGNAALCVGPVLLPQASVDGFSLNFTCPGITVPAKVVLPAAFSQSCSNSSDCSGAILVWSSYFSPEGDGVNVVMGAVKQYPHLLAEDRSINATLISGVMNVTLNYSGPAGAFCSNHSSSSSSSSVPSDEGCQARLQMPLNDLFDAAKSHGCIQLTPGSPGLDASRSLPVANITQSVMAVQVSPGKTRDATVTLANCLVDRQGLYAVVQFDGPALFAEDGSNPSLDSRVFSTEPVELDNAKSQLYTFTFDMDYDALAADADAVSEFKSGLQRALLTGIDALWANGPDLADANGALRLAHVVVNSLKAGSVIADVLFVPPVGTTSKQMEELVALVPADLISSSDNLQSSLLKAELSSGSAAQDNRAIGRAKLGAGAIAGIVVGCVVAAATVVILVAVVTKGKATGTAHVPESGAAATLPTAASTATLPANDKVTTAAAAATRPANDKVTTAAAAATLPAANDKVTTAAAAATLPVDDKVATAAAATPQPAPVLPVDSSAASPLRQSAQL